MTTRFSRGSLAALSALRTGATSSFSHVGSRIYIFCLLLCGLGPWKSLLFQALPRSFPAHGVDFFPHLSSAPAALPSSRQPIMASPADEQLVDYEPVDSGEAPASPITATAAAAGDCAPPAATADAPTAGATPPAPTSEAVGATLLGSRGMPCEILQFLQPRVMLRVFPPPLPGLLSTTVLLLAISCPCLCPYYVRLP